MIEKLSENQFIDIRNQMFDILEKINELEDYHNGDYDFEDEDSKDFFLNVNNYDEEKKKLIDSYNNLLILLLSYDLSNISPRSWHILNIVSFNGDIIDFSKTKANIDFKTVDFDAICNFKSCNIENLEYYNHDIKPEYFDDNTINKYPQIFLSDLFSDNFKDKYYNHNLTMEDIIVLQDNQIEELSQKKLFKYIYDENITNGTDYFKYITLKKAIELYKYSKKDYEIVINLIGINQNESINDNFLKKDISSEFYLEINNADVKDIKAICYKYTRENILFNKHIKAYPEIFPQEFVAENDDLFLLNIDMFFTDLREKFQGKKLKFEDLINNYSLFKNVPIMYFTDDICLSKFCNILGYDNFNILFYKHFDFFEHLYDSTLKYYSLNKFLEYLTRVEYMETDYEDKFYTAVKKYFKIEEYARINTIYIPPFLKSFNFDVIEKYNSWDEMKSYNKNTFLIDSKQYYFIYNFGFENMKKFDKETGFFSFIFNESNSNYLDILYEFLSGYFFSKWINYADVNAIKEKTNFANGTLSYEKFVSKFSLMLRLMRNYTTYFEEYDYDFIDGTFRENNPELFMAKDAPRELKRYFYANKITIYTLQKYPEYIPYLLDKNLPEIINGHFNVKIKDQKIPSVINFLELYVELFGKVETFNLLTNFGDIADDLTTYLSFDTDPSKLNKEEIDKLFRNAIYDRIMLTNDEYYSIKDLNFRKEFSDLFISLEEVKTIDKHSQNDIIEHFYKRTLRPSHIKKFPQLVDILKTKNLYLAFKFYFIEIDSNFSDTLDDNELYAPFILNLISNENFLILCSKFGSYMNNITPINLKKYLSELNMDKEILKDIDTLTKLCEYVIAKQCLNGEFLYNESGAPEFLKKDYPELFLSKEAPNNLQLDFYSGLNFKKLSKFKHHISFLENKAVKTSFLKNNKAYRDSINRYFELFGDKALKLGLQKPETVDIMISQDNIELMYQWYQKSGNKFIPDYVVMENFPIEESDNFFASINYWSKLMKIEKFTTNEEYKEVMLKLAYSFGVFHNDKQGFNKLVNLLCGVPHTIPNDVYLDISKDNLRIMFHLIELKDTLKTEGFKVDDEKNLISKLYKQSTNNNYVLTIDPQKYPESMKVLRSILEIYSVSNILGIISPTRAHQLFGGFTMEYDKDFREFLLANLKNINEDNSIYISSIQKQFKEIKSMNSNRVLTFDLAVSYVLQNKYVDINIGNEKMAEIASIAGYTQNDFNTLQKIYNYGKTRVFSSIPRIENKTEKYTYEILRLDDPLALAIGTLTNCCQEIGNAAESCMEHSMIDPNGRVFVIRDIDENIVSQSWVWRNKDVLCFDNIEIPDKAFKRTDLNKDDFAKEVYDIYLKAAQELMEEDEKVYKQLLNENKITEEQYKGLRLGKVTVGLGYNDIADIIIDYAKKDNGNPREPLAFNSIINTNNKLYTSDSREQYILAERNDQINYEVSTLPIYNYNDTYKIYNDNNFTNTDLFHLCKLELATDEDNYLRSRLNDYTGNEIVSKIAYYYNLNPETTKIVMNANFAIIYEDNDSEIKIGEIFLNNEIGEIGINYDILIQIQIKLAIEQITTNKKLDINELDENKQELINNILNISKEIDIAKGLII